MSAFVCIKVTIIDTLVLSMIDKKLEKILESVQHSSCCFGFTMFLGLENYISHEHVKCKKCMNEWHEENVHNKLYEKYIFLWVVECLLEFIKNSLNIPTGKLCVTFVSQ